MDEFGFLSLIPPIIAIFMVLLTRSVIISLFIGLFSGILLLNNFHIIQSLKVLIKDFIYTTMSDDGNIGVLVLLIFIGGFVALLEISGGGKAFANKVVGNVKSRIKIQLFAWISGVAIFSQRWVLH